MEVWPPRSYTEGGLAEGQDWEWRQERRDGREQYPDVEVEVAIGDRSRRK